MSAERLAAEPRPAARSAGLLTRELAGELVVYDRKRHRAHCLNPAAAFLWRRCDGRTRVETLGRELGERFGLGDGADAARLGLRQLARAHLLRHGHREAPISRRQLLRRLGGASAAALLPLVTTVVAPTPAMAQTCLPKNAPCTSSAQCCSGCCRANNLKCKDIGPCI